MNNHNPTESYRDSRENNLRAKENIWDTAEDLKMLRRLCNIQKSTGEAEHITINESEYTKANGFADIEDAVLKALELPESTDTTYVRTLLESRLARTTALWNIDLDSATHWKVKEGVLILKDKSDGANQVLGKIELFPRELNCKKEVVAKTQAQPNQEEISLSLDGKTPDVIVGSADSSTHDINDRHKDEWYQRKIDAAQSLLQLSKEGRLLDTAKTFTRALWDELDALSDITPDQVKAYEKNFDKKNIFGPYGVYNVLLAFQRATTGRSIEPPLRIDIRIGSKSNSAADRYAEAWSLHEPETLKMPKVAVTPKAKKETKPAKAAAETKNTPEQSAKKTEKKKEAKPAPLSKAESIAAMRKMRRPLNSIKGKLEENPTFQTYIDNAIQHWNLPANAQEIMKAFLHIEAGFNPRAVGPYGHLGLAQASKETQITYWNENQTYWENLRGVPMPLVENERKKLFFDPEISIDLMAWYLKTTARDYRVKLSKNDSISDLYMIYNMGGGGYKAVKRYMKDKTPENFEKLPWFLKEEVKNKKGEVVKKADGQPLLAWEARVNTTRGTQMLYNALYADSHREDTILTGGAH